MTEQKHTPEPWRVNQIEQSHACNEFGVEIAGQDGEVIADNQLYYPAAITEANARRIVACINACAGLDAEYLETVGLPEFDGKQLCADMVQQELDAVTSQRDHWKANHENQVRRARILMERPDMPIERVAAYNRLLDLEKQRDMLLAALESLLVLADNGVESWRPEWDAARAALAATEGERC